MKTHVWYPHQIEALTRIRGQSRVALFMEMRLGKTPVIIRWAHEQTTSLTRPRILVVAPPQVLDDWVDELIREGVPSRDITRLDHMPTKERLEHTGAGWGWYLAHDNAIRLTEDLWDEGWDVLIVDESTMIRKPSAKITKILINLYNHIPNRAILTGDPRPEHELDYFTQFQFLHGHFMGFDNPFVFRQVKFTQSPWAKWDWTPRPGLRDEIKAYVHQHAVVMTAEGVGMERRPIFKVRTVDMNDAQRSALKQITKDWEYGQVQTNFATVRDLWLARIAGGFSPERERPAVLSSGKADAIIELLSGEMRRQSHVIWFRFNEELDYMVERLNKAKIPAIGVHGGTPRAERQPIRKAFNRGKYRVICVQQRLGKFGWNLSRADVAHYYSRMPDYEVRNQSLKRIVHMTKARAPLYIDWVTRGTLDYAEVIALRDKRTNSRSYMRQLNAAAVAYIRGLYGFEDKKEDRPEKETAGRRVRRIFPGDRIGLD